MSLNDALHISAAGMHAQGERLKIVAENLANADSTTSGTNGQPYRRQIITFKNVLDKENGVETVKVDKHTFDTSDPVRKFDPTHPSADPQGYVTYPNVNPIVEKMDMYEARRGYEANLDMVQVSKSMMTQMIGLLKQ